jgi:hypothetical protein
MPNSCGFIVFNWVTTLLVGHGLYTYRGGQPATHGYKSSKFSVSYLHVIQQFVHNFFTTTTEVITTVVHTIHTTNKHNKKFYIHNLLLIYRKAVH